MVRDTDLIFILLQATISQLEGPGQISGHQVAGASLVGISWDPMSTTGV